jgi:Ca2+-binding EF-hand superfamily protein
MGCGSSSASKQVEVRKASQMPAPAEDGTTPPKVREYIEQMKKYKTEFNKVDGNGSGFLSKKEVKKLLSSGGEHASSRAARSWIKKHDDDNDGKISWDEFVTAMDTETLVKSKGSRKNKTGTGPTLEDVMKFFADEYGTDDMETLNKEQIVRFYEKQQKMEINDANVKCKEIIARGGSADGQGVDAIWFFKEASRNEPHQAKQIREKRYKAAVLTLAAKFKLLDVDGNGNVSKDELFADGRSRAQVDDVVEYMDGDNDGNITWEEFKIELRTKHNIMVV